MVFVIVICYFASMVSGENVLVDFEYTPSYKALVPCQWASVFPTCGGCHQSPVDLSTSIKEICQPPLAFTNLLGEPQKVELIHMLHTPLVKYHTTTPVTVSGGPLSGSYIFDHYNIRWGEDGKKGSEHTIDGKSYAGELQLVFYKNTTNGFHEAINMTDGVVIFAVWLDEVGYPDNAYFDEMLGMMDYITQPWSYTDLCEKIPIKYYLPEYRMSYFTYRGSLTYPPCPETVIWVIFLETLPFSHYQFIKLRRMIGVRGSISTNVRPIQKSKAEIFKVQTPPACIGQ